MKTVISLYDYTGVALRPWAEAGYHCFAFDIQHSAFGRLETFDSGGSITYLQADLHQPSTFRVIKNLMVAKQADVIFGMAFPVCTDLAVSGAAHFARKAEANPDFQHEAASYAMMCAEFFEGLGCPYLIENPVSVLATLWRKPDYRFQPYEYGGYIPEEQAEHPTWPEYIAPRDAYPKRTCLWTGCGFQMPVQKPVEYSHLSRSTQDAKLGGKSMKTKNIRSATPRGFAKAVFLANAPKPLSRAA